MRDGGWRQSAPTVEHFAFGHYAMAVATGQVADIMPALTADAHLGLQSSLDLATCLFAGLGSLPSFYVSGISCYLNRHGLSIGEALLIDSAEPHAISGFYQSLLFQ